MFAEAPSEPINPPEEMPEEVQPVAEETTPAAIVAPKKAKAKRKKAKKKAKAKPKKAKRKKAKKKK
jgi:hypothetical protein